MSAAEVWYLAVCRTCEPVLPQPFTDEGERDAWAVQHAAGTGHEMAVMTETRGGAADLADGTGWVYLGVTGGGGRLWIAPLGTPAEFELPPEDPGV